MRFFLDTANINEIKECKDLGLLDGITTNPSLVSKEKDCDYTKLCSICEGLPVSLEVSPACDSSIGMVKEARELLKYGQDFGNNVVIKLPITMEGIKACKVLSSEGIDVNMTLCFSASQALLCAKAGARYVSPFVGRLEDIELGSGIKLVEDIRQVFDNYLEYQTEILAASIRTVQHVEDVAKAGTDVITMPMKVIREMFKHEMTDRGMEKFLNDWNNK